MNARVKKRASLIRALNARIETAEDLESVRQYELEKAAGTLVVYSSDLINVSLLKSYVSRFKTKRLSKKYSWFFSSLAIVRGVKGSPKEMVDD